MTIDVAVAQLQPALRLMECFKRLCCHCSLALIVLMRMFSNKTSYCCFALSKMSIYSLLHYKDELVSVVFSALGVLMYW